ncbi:MAG: flavin reductase family protein [Chloroflexota bacterium]|nr:flavin reductase family protein [Chloroflexota bacterium]MDE3193082.1 flavin reductase family protein [Chloroflexota bacterium]
MTVSPDVDESERFALAKAALSQLPHCVVVVGAAADGERSCATATAMYVSLAPAQIAVALFPGSHTAKLVERSGELSVSVLTPAQQGVAAAAGRSAPSGQDKFTALRIPVLDAPAGASAPAVAGSLAVLWCRVVRRIPTGDHVLHVGEVVAHRTGAAEADALLRFRRRYLGVGRWTSDESPEGYPV